jgi:hypothetical protein
MLSYRLAAGGLVGGVLVMGGWLWLSGLPLMWLPVFLAVALGIFFGLTRIVVEGGVAAARSPMIASTFLVSGVGAPQLGSAGLTALAYTYIWHGDVRTFVMASCANGLKVVEGLGRLRPLFWVLLLAIAVTLAGSGIGGGVMALLLWVRHRFLWWPLNPLGYFISSNWKTGHIFFPCFAAWLFKSVILKYGGPRLYRDARPFFLGLILGEILGAGAWLVLDYLTGHTDNFITKP